MLVTKVIKLILFYLKDGNFDGFGDVLRGRGKLPKAVKFSLRGLELKNKIINLRRRFNLSKLSPSFYPVRNLKSRLLSFKD